MMASVHLEAQILVQRRKDQNAKTVAQQRWDPQQNLFEIHHQDLDAKIMKQVDKTATAFALTLAQQKTLAREVANMGPALQVCSADEHCSSVYH